MNVSSRQTGQGVYRFGQFTLDISDRRFNRGSCPVRLAPTKRSHAYIETVSASGYQFVGSIEPYESVGTITTELSLPNDREAQL